MTATIKIDPDRLPKPLLPPTKEVRVIDDTPVRCSFDSSSPSYRFPTREERRRKTRFDAWTPEQERWIWKMYTEGKMTQEEIGKETGRTKNAVFHRLQKLRKEKGVGRIEKENESTE